MKKMLIVLGVVIIFQLSFLKAESIELPNIKLDSLAFGDTLSLEIMTWNIQHFPKHEKTVNYVADIITAVDPDLIGLQEIESDSAFAALIVGLNKIDDNQWFGFRANSDEWKTDLAFLYKSEVIIIKSITEIFAEDSYDSPFPRRPLVLEFFYKGIPLVVINNHLKAMPGTDNEARRREAIGLLNNYIMENYLDDRLIMLGDFNDYLTDPPEENVFNVILDNPAEFKFADMGIAANPNSDWSYPYYKYRGHLDHILISNELYENYSEQNIKVVVIDRFMEGGEDNRFKYITDHRPVILKLQFNK